LIYHHSLNTTNTNTHNTNPKAPKHQ